MELTASRLLLATFPVLAVCLVGGILRASEAQRIVSFPSAAGYETTRRDRVRGEFPRREELLQALDFLEEYERGKENDWNKDQDIAGALYSDDAAGNNDFDLDNGIYPGDADLDFRQQPNRYPEYTPIEDNSVDIPPWLANYLLREAQEEPEGYPGKAEPGDFPWSADNQELLEMALEEEEEVEEAEEEAYREQVQREEEEEIADIVEEEMEDMAVENILDDLWVEEVLQKDAEDQLKWLLIEEEEGLQKEEEEEGEEDKDPFLFEDLYSDWDLPIDSSSAEADGESILGGFSEGLVSDYGAEYPMSSSEEDYVGESLDDEEKEELMEEAAEILDLQDQEEDEEEERLKELRASRILESLVETLTREAIQEEVEEENDEEEEEEEEEEEGFADDEADEEDVGDNQSSSVLNAGMGDEDSVEIDEEKQVEKEVYKELIQFLEEEIDRAVDDVAEDILQVLDEEEAKEEEEGEYESLLGEASLEEESQEETSDGSEEEPGDGDVCPALRYFIDDCNIVNNYADLGADGYKDLFAGACNRHQLCYACGEYYDVGTKLCDELYKAEMLARCEGDDTACRQRAKYFWLVARNNRVPAFESSPICGDPCILSFLVEV